jgi:hypothetical protein
MIEEGHIMSPPSVVKVGRIRSGYRIRVEGRGTLRESPAVHEFAGHVLRDGASTLVQERQVKGNPDVSS